MELRYGNLTKIKNQNFCRWKWIFTADYVVITYLSSAIFPQPSIEQAYTTEIKTIIYRCICSRLYNVFRSSWRLLSSVFSDSPILYSKSHFSHLFNNSIHLVVFGLPFTFFLPTGYKFNNLFCQTILSHDVTGSIPGTSTNFKCGLGLERGPPSLVRTIG